MNSNGMKYGIWDTKEKCWIGRDDGPLLYTDELHARAAMTILNEMFNSGYRFRMREFPTEKLVDAGTYESEFTGEQAIARIEARIP